MANIMLIPFRKSLGTVAAGIAALCFGYPSAFANTNVELIAGSGYSSPANPYQSGNGGEFTALMVSSSGHAESWVPEGYSSLATYTYHSGSISGLTGFETFCVEYNNEFTPGPGTSYNYEMTEYIQGNNPNPDNGTKLSVGVAWLYSQFAQGELSGYNYTNATDRKTDAGLLQDTIWSLLGMGGYTIDTSDIFTDDVLEEFDPGFNPTHHTTAQLNTAIADAEKAATDGEFGVLVLDLTTGSGRSETFNQDQLIYVAGNNVPDNGMTALWVGAALIGLALSGRRLARLCSR